MDKFKRMVLEHAAAVAESRRLRSLVADELARCPIMLDGVLGANAFGGKNCLQLAYEETRSMNAEANPYDGYSYDEVLESMENPPACDHCKTVRNLKSQRARIGRKIGAIRAAMTRAAQRECTHD